MATQEKKYTIPSDRIVELFEADRGKKLTEAQRNVVVEFGSWVSGSPFTIAAPLAMESGVASQPTATRAGARSGVTPPPPPVDDERGKQHQSLDD